MCDCLFGMVQIRFMSDLSEGQIFITDLVYVFQSIRSSEVSETERSTSDQLVTDKVYSSLRGH